MCSNLLNYFLVYIYKLIVYLLLPLSHMFILIHPNHFAPFFWEWYYSLSFNLIRKLILSLHQFISYSHPFVFCLILQLQINIPTSNKRLISKGKKQYFTMPPLRLCNLNGKGVDMTIQYRSWAVIPILVLYF